MMRALDANIIIGFLSKEPSVVKRFDKTAIDGIGMVIPSVVDYEVLRGFCHTPSPRKEAVYHNMRINCPVVEVDAAIWKRAASIWAMLRKTGRTIGDADILIAAHCIENGYILATHNIKHFKDISGLLTEDWTE
jgi:predicted nucleic acid-binding protein